MKKLIYRFSRYFDCFNSNGFYGKYIVFCLIYLIILLILVITSHEIENSGDLAYLKKTHIENKMPISNDICLDYKTLLDNKLITIYHSDTFSDIDIMCRGFKKPNWNFQ